MITLNCIIKIRRADLKRPGKDDHCSKKIWKAVRTVPEYSLPVDLLERNWIFSLIKAYTAYVFQESFLNYSLYISPASIFFNWLLAVKIHVQIISELGITADRNHFGACIFRRRFLPIIVTKVPTVAYTTRICHRIYAPYIRIYAYADQHNLKRSKFMGCKVRNGKLFLC